MDRRGPGVPSGAIETPPVNPLESVGFQRGWLRAVGRREVDLPIHQIGIPTALNTRVVSTVPLRRAIPCRAISGVRRAIRSLHPDFLKSGLGVVESRVLWKKAEPGARVAG